MRNIHFLYLILAISLGTAASAAAEQATNDNKSPRLNDFVLYAQRSIVLSEDVQVIGGNVGVHLPSVFTGSQLTISHGSKIAKGGIISPSTNLADKSVKADFILTDAFRIGTEVTSLKSFPSMPGIPFRPAPAAADTKPKDVTIGPVAAGKKFPTFPPGTYGALRIKVKSGLVLGPGSYTFASVTLERGAQLVTTPATEGDIQIAILGRLIVETDCFVGTSATPSFLLPSIFVYASDGPTADKGITSKNAAAYIGGPSGINALVVVPHGTLMFGTSVTTKGVFSVTAKGAFAAYDIVAGSNALFFHHIGFADSSGAQLGTQKLSGYLPTHPVNWPVVGMLPSKQTVNLGISLPARVPNPGLSLPNLVKQVSDPKSPTFRQYIAAEKFKADYGATDDDYTLLKTWATSYGLKPQTFSNNLYMSVTGTIAQFEQLFNGYLVLRQRPDKTVFLSIDRNPSINLSTLTILDISGLDSYITPNHHLALSINGTGVGGGTPGGDAAPSSYKAADLRAAYLGGGPAPQRCALTNPGVPLSKPLSALGGTGQVVGLVEFVLATSGDVSAYDASQAPPINPNNVLTAFAEGMPNTSPQFVTEAVLDIAMVQAMAPNATILVFQATTGITGHLDDIYASMATSNPPLTVASSSIEVKASGGTRNSLSQMAVQGISFFQSAGDFGDIGDPQSILDEDNQTLVGGTFLMTNPLVSGNPPYPNNYQASESVWNWNNISPAFSQQKNTGGGGIMNGIVKRGVCFLCAGKTNIPWYQLQLNISPAALNGAGFNARVYPDVSMVADNIEIFLGAPNKAIARGTSAGAPLWAGFTALANQISVQAGRGTIGFLNPAIYAIGATSQTANDVYVKTFNDINDGLTNNNGFGNGFPSVPGFDMATGWGTPSCNLLLQLAAPDPLAPDAALVLLNVAVVTGDDDLRDDSELTAVITLQDDSSFPVVLHAPGTGSWDNGLQQIVPNIAVPCNKDGSPPPCTAKQITMSAPIKSITITKTPGNGDNWDLQALNVTASDPGQPGVCQINLVGTLSLDGGKNAPGLWRFKNTNPGDNNDDPNSGISKTFLFSCP